MTKIAISSIQCMRKIEPGAPVWKKFNASFKNADCTTSEIMDAIYEGYPVTTQLKEPWRTSENYLMGQHLALDFDTEDKTSTIDYLVKDKFIDKYGTFVHTTISHSPEAPRARVFFLLDQPIHQAKNYTLAASALLWLFGTADRQCKDAVRFFYGAPGCEFEFIGGFLPLTVVKGIIRRYQESGSREMKNATREYRPSADDQQEVADALRFIPAWGIDYDEWLAVLMAIHSKFGDAGFALADSWAQGKKNEVSQKWKGFKAGGNAAGAVTIGTLFAIAKRNGWRRQHE